MSLFPPPPDESRTPLTPTQAGAPGEATALDHITALARYAFKAPAAAVSLLGEVEQRFLSAIGLPVTEADVQSSICAHAVASGGVFVVSDLTEDPRFRDHPLVAGPPHLRFYAGAPMIDRNGIAIGAVCVLDHTPRLFGDEDRRQLTALAGMAVDALELGRMSGRLDPVSGIPGRNQFHADFQRRIERPHTGTLYAVAVDALDIPSASQISQVLGLGPLEALIRRVGVRLCKAMEGIAEVYHVGVTRFAFVVEMPSPAGVEPLVQELRSRVVRPLMATGVPMIPRFHATALDVCAVEADSHSTLRKLLVGLNDAYERREAFCWYTEQRDEKVNRAYRLASDAQRGLRNGDFYLEYQPRFCASQRCPISAEALIRWNHPRLGPISPQEFIAVFERTALIDEVTDWVMERALDQFEAWRAEGRCIPLSINLPGSYLATATAWEVIRHRLSSRSIPFSMIEFEITEGEWLNPASTSVGQIHAMAGAGVKISIDDFGSGYSNFNYLSDLPIHTLKLDKSLVDRIAKDQRSRAKVSAINNLAHELGYLTVAEGVEDTEQLDVLQSLGLDQVQGYLFARPLSATAVATLFHRSEEHLLPAQ